ncbi:ATP-dependent Clp protease ATP-binding subunit CLPT2, chloroplastic [Cynara cardunculus var. scolymus]|uniref:ATP-dependent Clp protease ATP-binding subunit CLPT2, chloroplastic n=1 Tax=Cynara cardunculus var. scolymus TaxID=59895 RepID=UPI000D62F83D|nr:ATP-dependent Clp protease ATP-binding subunit CLPT2, chloroplastic [Cynara cardunculus var. scolymus]
MAAHTLFSFATISTRCSHHDSIKPDPFSQNLQIRTHKLQSQWLAITKLPLQSSNLQPCLPKTRPIAATVTFSLPTANPESANSIENAPKWSLKGIKSFAMGELEARKLKFSTTGTEAILMGILVEGTNRASKLLRADGFTLSKVREEAIKLIGEPDYFYFSPEHPPLTESAQKALDWAVDEKLKSGDDGEITTSHLLLGVWLEEEAAGHKIMATLGFNDEKAEELRSVISKPGFVEE